MTKCLVEHLPGLPGMLDTMHSKKQCQARWDGLQVVRGGPAFAVSLVLSAIEPALRASAELGAWQLISPGDATGRVVVVQGLHEVQDEVRFTVPQESIILESVLDS